MVAGLRLGVVVVFVLFEGDAVLLRQCGVLIILRRCIWPALTGTEPERGGTGLLQLSRFFEAAVTTLLHGRAPGLARGHRRTLYRRRLCGSGKPRFGRHAPP